MTIYAKIKAIEYYLPETILTNEQLAIDFPDWTADKIKKKTGIETRHIASKKDCASDLAFRAAIKLFESNVYVANDVDFLLLCTQSPDYFLPTTACLLQARLNLQISTGALDFNLGCSGYVYGLSLAKGLIESGQAKNVLLITADTYSKYIRHDDRTTRTLFGDAAAATLIQGVESHEPFIESFVFGTDGRGANNLIVHGGAMREQDIQTELYMNGPEILTFTLRIIEGLVERVLSKANRSFDDIDLFVFHQANQYLLDHLRDKLKIPKDKFYIFIKDTGNTVSSTIPIALKSALLEGRVSSGNLVMLIGFGVGYSWGGGIIRIT